MKRILVTGAAGQIGSELTTVLRQKYGKDQVIASGLKTDTNEKLMNSGPFEYVDCTDFAQLKFAIQKYKVDTIYHLAAILSGVAEAKPQLACEFNCTVFNPSSIGVFGPGTPSNNTPQVTIQRPNTMYGVTKVTGELLCDYYYKRFKVETRGLRYPGIISNETLPGGGTTDYAVEIYYEAIKNKSYTCILKEGTKLDMMYMPDALNGANKLMETYSDKLKHRNAFNVSAMSFAPEDVYAEIKKHIPDFTMDYKIDPVRQSIADSWPNSMDDSAARVEWGWNPRFNLSEMTKDMLNVLSKKLK
ncbi:MAG: NAD-dependent epimerase/dehydratase family protein [Calditrichota bacterium]